MFAKQLKAPDRGSTARQNLLSPLNEMTDGQIASYTAPQLATILRQHESAVNSAIAERQRYQNPYQMSTGRPYIVDESRECRTMLCPQCGRGGNGEEMSFMSIDGVLKGDIPPTAALGFGFRALGARPVADAKVVKNLGLRDPKTGLLPGQAKQVEEVELMQKSERFLEVEMVEGVKGAGMQRAKMGVFGHRDDKMAVSFGGGKQMGLESDEQATAESSQPLKKEDTNTSIETGGPRTPSEHTLAEFDTRDDLIQLYVDSSEDVLDNMAYDDGEDAADSGVNENDDSLI